MVEALTGKESKAMSPIRAYTQTAELRVGGIGKARIVGLLESKNTLLTAPELVDLLALSRTTLYQMAHARVVSSFRVGDTSIRFDPKHIADWVAQTLTITPPHAQDVGVFGKARIIEQLESMSTFLEPEDVAELLAISRSFAYKLAARQRMPSSRMNLRVVRVDPKQLADWLTQRMTPALGTSERLLDTEHGRHLRGSAVSYRQSDIGG